MEGEEESSHPSVLLSPPLYSRLLVSSWFYWERFPSLNPGSEGAGGKPQGEGGTRGVRGTPVRDPGPEIKVGTSQAPAITLKEVAGWGGQV